MSAARHVARAVAAAKLPAPRVQLTTERDEEWTPPHLTRYPRVIKVEVGTDPACRPHEGGPGVDVALSQWDRDDPTAFHLTAEFWTSVGGRGIIDGAITNLETIEMLSVVLARAVREARRPGVAPAGGVCPD